MAQVFIAITGVDEAIARFEKLSNLENLQKQTELLAKDAKKYWQGVTPKRSGRMRGEESAPTGQLSFKLMNMTRYYDWVDLGHSTPRYHHRHGKIIRNKRVHQVPGQHFTEKAIAWINENIGPYLEKAFDDV